VGPRRPAPSLSRRTRTSPTTLRVPCLGRRSSRSREGRGLPRRSSPERPGDLLRPRGPDVRWRSTAIRFPESSWAPRGRHADHGWAQGKATSSRSRSTGKGSRRNGDGGLVVEPGGDRARDQVPLLTIVTRAAGSFANNFSRPARATDPLFAQKGFASQPPNPRGSGGTARSSAPPQRPRLGGEGLRGHHERDRLPLAQGVGRSGPLASWAGRNWRFRRRASSRRRSARRAASGAGVSDTFSFVGTAHIPPFLRIVLRRVALGGSREYIVAHGDLTT